MLLIEKKIETFKPALPPAPLSKNWPRVFPGKANLSFSKPAWNKLAGQSGAYVSESNCGNFEAMAEPIPAGWRFWLIPTDDPESAICMEDTCA